MNFKISAWSAIINAVIVIPLLVIISIVLSQPGNIVLLSSYILISLISLIAYILILMGFISLANLTKNIFLRNMAYVILVVGILSLIIEIMTLFKEFAISDIVILIIVGITSILFGISVLKLKEVFGGIATGLGVLYIIEGAFEVTIIFVLLVPLTMIIISILEAILFFNAAKKYTV
ncbi:MAG: hypothetical protein KKA61_00305 [Nanoarchaeota archaeon]|nr:hypothetical protein [Nanoarchaeota archaeon]MBU4492792.1 hypothetical protein [Nanoarchaeota archaeon]